MDNHGRLEIDDLIERPVRVYGCHVLSKGGEWVCQCDTAAVAEFIQESINTHWPAHAGTRSSEELANGTPLEETLRTKHRWWTGWVGNYVYSPVVMYISRPFKIPGTKLVLEFHKFVNADAAGCYHSHPYKAWRMVLWGGYTEEVAKHVDKSCGVVRASHFTVWKPGRMGFVGPGFIHRVDSLRRNASYSIWIHGPRTHEVKLYGY